MNAQAMEKAKAEYKRYQAQTLSPVEEEYLKTINQLGKTAKTEAEKKDDPTGISWWTESWSSGLEGGYYD